MCGYDGSVLTRGGCVDMMGQCLLGDDVWI